MRIVALFWLGIGIGCGVRGAGAGDLVGEVTPASATLDGGSGAPAEHPRIEIKCKKPPIVTESKLVSVPSGTFQMGCNASVDQECRSDERPAHLVRVDGFEMDATEVTQGQYYECVVAKACGAPACDWDPCEDGKRKDHPVVCVNYEDATKYCAWKNMRLPTEAEWERASRGDDARKYPWGNDGLDCEHANLASCPGPSGAPPGTLVPGSLPKGISPYGAFDMAGNAGEWVSDRYDPNYYASSPAENPKGPQTAAGRYVGRGGGWRSTGVWQRTSQRDDYEAAYVKDTMGFRCVR